MSKATDKSMRIVPLSLVCTMPCAGMNWYVSYFTTTIAPTLIVPLLWLAAALLARRGSARVKREYQLAAGDTLDVMLDEAKKSADVKVLADSNASVGGDEDLDDDEEMGDDHAQPMLAEDRNVLDAALQAFGPAAAKRVADHLSSASVGPLQKRTRISTKAPIPQQRG